MTELVRKYNVTNVNDPDLIGCVFDWFEVRIKGTPKLDELVKLGYSENLDKGCATHAHYFENSELSISWDIRSCYINKVWSHLRVKNSVFYSLRGFNALVDWVIQTSIRIFDCSKDDVIISRIDFAFDMPVGSFWHNVLRDLFKLKKFDLIDKYTEFYGKVNDIRFTNYSAGNRGSVLFFRLYYKTIENTSYRDCVPKKQYIADWHKMLFGNQSVIRFEIEYKPQGNNILTDLVYNRFIEFWEKYACGCDCKLYISEGYQSNDLSNEFTEKDRIQLVKLMRKFLHSPWDVNYNIQSYFETIEEFTDILENVLGERV